jgi:hypothetical protein
MDRQLLEAEVRRVRQSGITSAPDVLRQLQKSAERAAVTLSQVSRINTACKKLEPQLDSAAKAAKRKAAEKEREKERQKRVRTGRARPADEAAKERLDELQRERAVPRHVYDLDPMEFGGLVLRDCWPRDSASASALAYLQPQPPASSEQSEPSIAIVDLSRGFGSYSSWSAGLEFLAKQVSDHQAVAACLVVKSSAIQHPPLPSWIQEQDGIIVQLEAPGISKLWFTSRDANAEETFDVDFDELDLLPAFFDSWHCDVAGPSCARSSPDECSTMLPFWQCELCDFAACVACCTGPTAKCPSGHLLQRIP